MESKSWFIKCYGAIFSALFTWVFVILIVYRWFDKAYFPDWNALFQGYSDSLNAHNITLNWLKWAVQWCYDQLMSSLTFGHFGQDGWAASLYYGFNLLMGGVAALVYGMMLISVAGLYLGMLLTSMLSMVGFVLGAQVESNNLLGSLPPVTYNTSALGYGDASQYGYDTIYSPLIDWSDFLTSSSMSV